MLCGTCLHRNVCDKCNATGGDVRKCEHYWRERHAAWRQRIVGYVTGAGQKYRVKHLCTCCNTEGDPCDKQCRTCLAIMDLEW